MFVLLFLQNKSSHSATYSQLDELSNELPASYDECDEQEDE
ncbi:hypothetical protein PDJ95_26675 [Bacillus cereus]|nr:hypothetical protein [Bacillus cereus]